MKAPKIAIVGGSGRMGVWFAQYFKNKGYTVVLSARNREKLIAAAEKLGVNHAKNNEEAVKNADLVMVSVTIPSTASVIREIAPHVDRKATVFDITSVKGDIIKTLEEQTVKYGFKAVSIHPMFGPGAKNLMNHTVAIIPIKGSEDAAEKLGAIFSEEGAKVVLTDGQTHDRMISTVLSLPHFLNILFGKALLEIPDTLPQIKEFSGTTFALQLLLTECVFGEAPELYSEIQMKNNEFLKFLDKLEGILSELKRVIQKNEKAEFSKIFEMVREKLMQDTDYANAYDLFYQIIEILKNRT
ncbi:MAG: prephenate dehydrogenase/arogenate dehydrogenase family protein [Candidatus Freyarchaeum deiterrae]